MKTLGFVLLAFVPPSASAFVLLQQSSAALLLDVAL
jgi:hypothetical protein